MSLLHADNFNYYGVGGTTSDTTLRNNMLDGVYAELGANTAPAVDPDGITSDSCLRLSTGNNTGFIRWVLPAAQATVGMAQRLWLETIPAVTNTEPRIEWRNASNGLIGYIWVNTVGGISWKNGGADGSASTADASTTGPVLTASGWYHIEAKLVCSTGGSGTLEVRVEGVTVLSVTGITTSDATCAQVRPRNWTNGAQNAVTAYLKDFVVWDGAGSQNNDFLGSVIVYELFTTADTTFGTGWTSTGANAYGVLDNNPPNDGVDYISADSTPPAAAVFAMSNLPADVSSVKGLITRVRAAKSDGGDGQLQVSLRSSGVDDAGTDRAITVAQTYWSDVSELDPNTAAAWTPGAVDAASLVIDRTL